MAHKDEECWDERPCGNGGAGEYGDGNGAVRGRKGHPERGAAEYVSLARLVRRAQAGDRGAFDELYRRTAQMQYFVIVGKVGREAAGDILQELYLIAWENIAAVRPRAFVGYLNATARHLCLRHFQRRGTSQEPAPAEDRVLEETGLERGGVAADGAAVADPAVVVAHSDERARLARALREELGDDEREAVLMRYYQRMRLDEIAASLKVSRATVKRRLASALDKLREKVAMLPEGAALAALLARAVEDPPAPEVLDRGVLGDGAGRDGAKEPRERRWVTRAVGLAAVAVAVGAVAFAAVLPRPEVVAEDGAPLAAPVEAPEDTVPPVLEESRTEGDATVLRFADDSGTAEVYCTAPDGTRYEAELVTASEAPTEDASDRAPDQVPGPASSPAAVRSTWRLSLPNGGYTLVAADACGNRLEAELTVAIPPDLF